MDSQKFVKAIERHVRDAAIEDTILNLKTPSGRGVSPEIRSRSEWYRALSEEEIYYVNGIIANAVHNAIFGFLASLDGSRTIDDERGRFELTHVTDHSVLLNPASIDLHDFLELPS